MIFPNKVLKFLSRILLKWYLKPNIFNHNFVATNNFWQCFDTELYV